MELLVPHYRLEGEYITPVDGQPVKRVEAEGTFWPEPGAAGNLAELSPALREVFEIAAAGAEPGTVLAYSNRYGTLGANVWNPWDGWLGGVAPEDHAVAGEEIGRVMLARLAVDAKEQKVSSVGTPRTCAEAVEAQPYVITRVLWEGEYVETWRRAALDLRAFDGLLRSLMLLRGERHSSFREVKDYVAPDARSHVGDIQLFRGVIASGRVPSEAEERLLSDWGMEYPIAQRLIDALLIVEGASVACSKAVNRTLVPRAAGVGWEWEVRPPNVLALLYASLLGHHSRGLRKQPARCRVPDCGEWAREGSEFCGKRCDNRWQKRRHDVKEAFKKEVGRGPDETEQARIEETLRAERADGYSARAIAREVLLTSASPSDAR